MSNINHTQRSASWSRASAVTERNHAQGIAAVRSSSEHLRSQSVPRLSSTEGVNLPTAGTRTGRTAVRRAYGAYRAAPITPDKATPGLQATFNVEKKQPISISKAKSKAANPQMPTPAFKTVSKVSKPSSSGASGAIPKATAKPIKLNLEAFLSTAKSTQRYKPDSQASARYRPEPRRRFVVESDTDSDSDDCCIDEMLSKLTVSPPSKSKFEEIESTDLTSSKQELDESSQSKVLDEIEPAQPRQISFIHSDSKKDEAKAEKDEAKSEKEKSEDSTEDMQKTATTAKHYGAKPTTPKAKKRSISLPFLKGFTKGKQKTPLAEIPPRILTSDSFYDTMLSDEEKNQYKKIGYIKSKQLPKYPDAWEIFSGHFSENIANKFKAKILSLLTEEDSKNLNIVIRPIIDRPTQWELYAGYFSEENKTINVNALIDLFAEC